MNIETKIFLVIPFLGFMYLGIALAGVSEKELDSLIIIIAFLIGFIISINVRKEMNKKCHMN